MKEKDLRINALKTIIAGNELATQKEVLDALEAKGFTVTQATLSRDMKRLKVAKASNLLGEYVYVLPNDTMYLRKAMQQAAARNKETANIQSVRFSGHLGVIKTLPGYASKIAYDIDNGRVNGILGTVAGSDTTIFVIDEETPREIVLANLMEALPELKDLVGGHS